MKSKFGEIRIFHKEEKKDRFQLLIAQTIFTTLHISVANYNPAYFGTGTKLTVLGKKPYACFFFHCREPLRSSNVRLGL